MRGAMEGIPPGQFVTGSDAAAEIVPKARDLVETANGFIAEARAVEVPDEAAEAHVSFVQMFTAWQEWAKATADAFDASAKVTDPEVAEMARTQERNQQAALRHNQDSERLLKRYKISRTENDQIIRDAMNT